MFIAQYNYGVRPKLAAQNRLVERQKDQLGDLSNPKPHKFTNYLIINMIL